MSLAPHVLNGARPAHGRLEADRHHAIVDGQVSTPVPHGITAENVAKAYGISARDAGRAGPGQQKARWLPRMPPAASPTDQWRLAAEKGRDPVLFNADEYLNCKHNAEAGRPAPGIRQGRRLGHGGQRLKYQRRRCRGGDVSAKKAAALALPLASFTARRGPGPRHHGHGAVPASRKVLQRWLERTDVDLSELNEASLRPGMRGE